MCFGPTCKYIPPFISIPQEMDGTHKEVYHA